VESNQTPKVIVLGKVAVGGGDDGTVRTRSGKESPESGWQLARKRSMHEVFFSFLCHSQFLFLFYTLSRFLATY